MLRLNADPLEAGERVVRVPPMLMAGARTGAPSFGKSVSIDAVAISAGLAQLPRPCPSRCRTSLRGARSQVTGSFTGTS